MFDASHLNDLMTISNSLNEDNVGDAMVRASLLRSIIVDPEIKIRADRVLERIRGFARDATIGWKVFAEPITPTTTFPDEQKWQLVAMTGVLFELNYCFERVEEASIFTFENSPPVRFYVNAIFHYLTSLFLLDAERNEKKGFSRPGTVIKALQPLKLTHLLDPIYQVFNRPFGEEMTYGETVRTIRNKGFVHGSFSPENIKKTVKDSHIFNELQRIRFIENHWDLFDQLVILRLKLISIMTHSGTNLDEFSPSRLYTL